MSESNKRHEQSYDMAAAQNWEMRPRALMSELRRFLASVKDEGTSIDSGGGDGTGDLWVTVGGVEYFISARLSNKELAKKAG